MKFENSVRLCVRPAVYLSGWGESLPSVCLSVCLSVSQFVYVFCIFRCESVAYKNVYNKNLSRSNEQQRPAEDIRLSDVFRPRIHRQTDRHAYIYIHEHIRRQTDIQTDTQSDIDIGNFPMPTSLVLSGRERLMEGLKVGRRSSRFSLAVAGLGAPLIGFLEGTL